MKAKVLSVYDEGSLEGTSLIGAKGLSILIDADGERTLFDTGLRGGYLTHNTDLLNIDPDTVDRVVISHVHSDHTGGLQSFLERRKEAVTVLTPPGSDKAAEVKLLGRIPFKRIGMPRLSEDAASKAVMRQIGELTQLSPHLALVPVPPAEGGSMMDPPVGENALVLTSVNGPVLICGCCHSGICGLMDSVEETMKKKVSAVVGGIHLIRMNKDEVHALAKQLKEKGPPALYLNHCSGQTQRMRLREILGIKAVNDLYVGTEVQFDV